MTNSRPTGRGLGGALVYKGAIRGRQNGNPGWEGYTPLGFAGERTAARAEFNHVRWISHCRGMVQLPAAA